MVMRPKARLGRISGIFTAYGWIIAATTAMKSTLKMLLPRMLPNPTSFYERHFLSCEWPILDQARS